MILCTAPTGNQFRLGGANGEIIGMNHFRIVLNYRESLPQPRGGPQPREEDRHSPGNGDAWDPSMEHSPFLGLSTHPGEAVWHDNRDPGGGQEMARGLAKTRGQLREG